MPSGRFVNKTISISDQLASDRVPLEAALFFTWCIPHLDVDGRITGNPRVLKSLVVPTRDEISAGCIPELIRSLSGPDVELVKWYEADGTKVLWFPGFRRQQSGINPNREAKSKLPAYDVDHVKDLAAEQLRSNSGSTPDQVRTKVIEVNGSKEKLIENKKENPPLGGKKKRGSQISDDWRPTEEHRALAAKLKLDFALEYDRFRDHAVSVGRVCRDWDAAFRNWLRKAAEFTRNGTIPNGSEASRIKNEMPGKGRRNGSGELAPLGRVVSESGTHYWNDEIERWMPL